MKTVLIVQARMGSVRLPGKVLRDIGGTPMIGLLLDRLAATRSIDHLLVATSEAPDNTPLVDYVRGKGVDVFVGSEYDVLERYFRAASDCDADVVVRITGDCPLVDPQIIDDVVDLLVQSGADYSSNVEPPSFPHGLDVEAFTMAALTRSYGEARDESLREHVTLYMRKSGLFDTVNLELDDDLTGYRWTVDEAVDLEVVRHIFDYFAPRTDFSWREVLEMAKGENRPTVSNSHLKRNDGSSSTSR